MKTKRDTSKDGFRNQLEFELLTHFKGFWDAIQSQPSLQRLVNKALVNNAILKIPTRPYAYSTMTPYTSWDSLTDRTYTGLHLKPDPEFYQRSLPEVEKLAVLFQKQNGETLYSEKSTLLFPYFVQWFTDGFLRTDRVNRLKNTSNHHIDLCPVYGLTHHSTELLRSHKDGKLKSQIINGEEYPPFYYEDDGSTVREEFKDLYQPLNDETRLAPELKRHLFAMGVERANIQLGYVMLNTLCLREHNRLCDLLKQKYSTWDDERLFQTARNIVIVKLLKIIMEEYINHITPYNFHFVLDPKALTDNGKWYRLNWMTIEFTLVYRWHSALPDSLVYNGQKMSMLDTLWKNHLLTDRGLGHVFEESSAQPAARIGLLNTADWLIPVELTSIRLGRTTQLPSYNEYRKMCQFPAVTDFDQITENETSQKLLKDLYGTVDNIEFYVGLYAEDLRPNSTLPPLIGRMVGIDAFSQALTNPLLSEHVFNQETFSELGWEEIHNTYTLSQLLALNVPQSDRSFKVSFYRHPENQPIVHNDLINS